MTPLLRVQITNDNKDWRIHFDQINKHHETIKTLAKSTQEDLSQLHKEIEGTLEKISSREKYINSQFETQTQEFRVLQEDNSDCKQKHEQANIKVSELSNQLSRGSEELESIKSRIDDIGNGMTDSKPLVHLKQGYNRLKNEVKQLDLRTGVVRHLLLSAQMKSKSNGMQENGGLHSPIYALHA